VTLSAPTELPQPSGARSPALIVMGAGQSRLLSALLLGIAVAAVALAGPRFAAGFVAAPHVDMLADLGQATPPSVSVQARAKAAHGRALAWHAAPENHAALGALALAAGAHAAQAGDIEEARAALARSVVEHRAALAMSPLEPYVWARLLQGELGLGADPADVRAHLRLALASAPWEPGVVTARLGLAFASWSDLDDDTRRLFEPQIIHAARLYPSSLARQARTHRAQEQVLQALESAPDLLRRFSLAYSRI